MTILCPYSDCTQHIAIDSSIAGTQASCPTCGRPFVCPPLHEFPQQEHAPSNDARLHAPSTTPEQARRSAQSAAPGVGLRRGFRTDKGSSSRSTNKPKGRVLDYILLPFQFMLNWVGCMVGASLIGWLFMKGGWEAGLFTGIVFGFPVAILTTAKNFKEKRKAK